MISLIIHLNHGKSLHLVLSFSLGNYTKFFKRAEHFNIIKIDI